MVSGEHRGEAPAEVALPVIVLSSVPCPGPSREVSNADMLLQRNGGGDRAKSMSLLEESLAIASELGMRPLMKRVQSRRDTLGA